MKPQHLALVTLLTGCARGSWVATTWGEDFIETGIPADAFDDGCEAVFDDFIIRVTEASLLESDGGIAAEVSTGVFDLVLPGPQELGSAGVAAGSYSRARFTLGPAGGLRSRRRARSPAATTSSRSPGTSRPRAGTTVSSPGWTSPAGRTPRPS